MKGKLISSIAGLTLALGMSVANAGPAGAQNLANGATNAQPAPAAQGSAGMEAFSAVLGSAHYVPMSDRELSRVNGKQLPGVPRIPEDVPEPPEGVPEVPDDLPEPPDLDLPGNLPLPDLPLPL
jgi:hypothetical protein